MRPHEHADAGLYVHLPFCLRKCPYCAFYSEPIARHDPQPVVEAMLRELDLSDVREPVRTVYLGGGSPTCLPPDLLCGLIDAITQRTGQVEEFTVECNPVQADAQLLTALRRRGVNRVSIGAQSFDPGELITLGRAHSPAHIEQAVLAARTAGFDTIGLDLIFAIPGSTPRTLAESLKRAIALEPAHLSAYSLTWEDSTPLTEQLEAGRIRAIGEDQERAMHKQCCTLLHDAGYRQYEISNFALPGFECRHNLRYWHNLPVVGLGPSASGWYRGQRTTNIADLRRYTSDLQDGHFAHAAVECPDPLQVACETAVLGLRLIEGIELAAFARKTGFDALTLFADAIAAHRRSGLLEQTATHLRLTNKGRSLADTVACDFVLP